MNSEALTQEENKLALVLDDEEPVRSTIVDLLTLMGWSTVAASSVAEAKAAYKQHPGIALIVSDYNLSPGTGLEFARWVLRMSPDMKGIILSGNPSLPTEEIASLKWLFAAKPVSRERLDQLIAAVFRRL